MNTKPCPLCGCHPTMLTKSMEGPNHTGYPGNFTYGLKCKCGRFSKTVNDIYDSPEIAERNLIASWNEEMDDVEKSLISNGWTKSGNSSVAYLVVDDLGILAAFSNREDASSYIMRIKELESKNNEFHTYLTRSSSKMHIEEIKILPKTK